MNKYDEEIKKHEPIHEDGILWEDFKNLLRQGLYESDKVYFLKDIDGQNAYANKLLEAIEEATEELEEKLQELKGGE